MGRCFRSQYGKVRRTIIPLLQCGSHCNRSRTIPYSAHSMRATFITTALENGCSLEDVQRAAGHREPGTTKRYDRRGYNPEKSASFFATY